MPAGVTVPFKATGIYADGSAHPLGTMVVWNTLQPSVATVDVGGLVTTRSAGATGVQAVHPPSGVRATVTLFVSSATLTSIGVTPAAKNLGVGLTQTYTATGLFSDATKAVLKGGVVTWTSSAPGIATIDANGLATAVAPGVAVITVKHLLSGIHESVTLTVGAVTLSSIAVSPPSPNIPVMTSTQLTAIGTYTNGSTVDLTSIATWKSAKAAVATVSQTGLAVGIATGASTITASLGTQSGTALLTVGPISLTSLAVTPSTPTIPLGASAALVATGTFLDKTTHDVTEQVTWTSTNTKVITVSNAVGERGKLTTVALGTARVRATDPVTGVTTSVPVVVTAAALVSVTMNPGPVSVPAGLTLQCHANGLYSDGSIRDLTTAATWTISGTAGATVSNAPGSEGLVTAALVGASGFLTATDPASGISGQAALTVTAALQTGLEISPPVATVSVGLTQAFTATAVFSDASRMTRPSAFWTSSNLAALTVDANGVATAVAAGASVVSATDNGFAATANVTVTAPAVTSITISPQFPGPNPTPKGLQRFFRVIVRLSDGTASSTSTDVTWSTSNASVATISNVPGSQGMMTAVDVGSVVLMATHPASGLTATLNWAVSAAVLQGATLSPQNISVPAGRTATVVAIGRFSDGSTADVTQVGAWATGDPSIATITSGNPGAQSVTGVSVGVTSMVMSGRVTATGSVEVTPAVLDSLAVSGSASMVVGTVGSFTASGTFSDGTQRSETAQVLWSSSNSAIASVSNAIGHEGEVTAIGAGTVTITARDGATGLTASGAMAVTAVVPIVAVGETHTCVLLPGGKVRCWGLNDRGQDGDALFVRGDKPGQMGGAMPEVALGTGRSARAIAAGAGHTCAILDDGQVKCWGANDVGQLGTGDNIDRGLTPGTMGDALPAVQLGAGLTAKQITTKANHTCALLSNDTVKCWGDNSRGELGLGDTLARGGPGTMGDAARHRADRKGHHHRRVSHLRATRRRQRQVLGAQPVRDSRHRRRPISRDLAGRYG